MMAWVYLVLAILFEVTGTTSMKFSEGFQNFVPTVVIFVCYGISIAFLTMAVRTIDISVAYAIWSAVGMVIISAIGFFWFNEPATAWKMISIGIIIIGVVSLQLSDRAIA
jgi:small multidrug resistance pump